MFPFFPGYYILQFSKYRFFIFFKAWFLPPMSPMEDTLGRIWLPDELPEKSADDRSAAAVAESQRLPRTSWTLDLDLTLESAKRDMVAKVI